MFEILEADIVVMQETKIQRKDLQDDMVLVPGWDVYFSLPKHKKGTARSLNYPLCNGILIDSRQVTLGSQSTLATPSAPPSVPKKGLLVF
jgi:exonuclease III